MPGYYDIDDIIMEEEAVSVVFHVGANGVGLLDPGSETNCVEKGAKIDLPFWLSQELCRRRAVSIIVPPCFNQKMKKDVQADAACVDLGTRYPYFYEFGCKIFPLVGDKSIGPFLRHTFASRYKEMLSKSHTASINAIPKFVLRLSKEEYQMFDAAKSSMVEYKKWRVSHLGLTKSSLLGHKRKTDSQLSPSS
ncbi:putative DNA replication complex GINS protein PSF3 [Carex littledalei]|uniref:Putative DNA replication complex GINS protein PSF3 n=1 Tax=Carex littledalei TaxID=544730 RepID=A0A833RN46_9POAL|nr:putative DNA replication complex GINS protein PSF3 [Carex littledalei]